MASIIKHKDKWRAMVAIGDTRKTKVFDLKSDAKRWASTLEEEIRSGKYIAGTHSLHAAFRKYAEEVSPTKRGKRWELIRLAKLEKDLPDSTIDYNLTIKMAEWRDARLKVVAPATVRREMNLVASVLEQARREWRWCDINPIKDVRKPPSPPARRRGITQSEIEAICYALGYSDSLSVTTKHQEVAVAFQLGIETAMRAGEILSADYDLSRRVARLEMTKNGDRREVPLSSRAVFLKSKVPLWTVNSKSLDVLFRGGRDKSGVSGMTFHDSRGEGITRLSKKLDVMQLARAIGHRSLSSLLFYYSEKAEDLAKKLG